MKFHKKWNFTRNIFQMGSQKRIHPKLSQIVFSRVKMMVNHRIWGIHSCSFPPKSGTISCQETRRWCFDRWGGSPFGCSLGPQPLNNRTTLSAGCFRIFRSIQHVFVSSSFHTFQTFMKFPGWCTSQSSWTSWTQDIQDSGCVLCEMVLRAGLGAGATHPWDPWDFHRILQSLP
jgi:hypothetical protein